MKHMLMILLTFALRASAQPIYTPYAFTNFAGMPGGAGNVDGFGNSTRFAYASGVAADLRAWTPVQTNIMPPTSLELSLPFAAKEDLFFRSRLKP